MMNELKTVFGGSSALDGTFRRMGGSKLSMNAICSSCFSAGDRKNLIAETKKQNDFQICKFNKIYF